MTDLLDRISIHPMVCFGKPCIRGTRIWVSLILDYLASGMSEQEIIAEYPHLTHEDILAAIAYGAEAARERIIPVRSEGNCGSSNLDGYAYMSVTGRNFSSMLRPVPAVKDAGPYQD